MMKTNNHEFKAQIGKGNETPMSSIFRLNLLEIVFGILIGVLLILSFRHTVLGVQSYRSRNQFNRTAIEAKADLFQDLSWTFFPIGFLAAVSSIRTVRRQNHQVPLLGQITPRGYFAFIWPMLLIIPDIQILFVLSFAICWPTIIVMTVVVCGYSQWQYDTRGDLLPALLTVLALIPFIFYTLRVWALISENL
jgi:hypothetical protein